MRQIGRRITGTSEGTGAVLRVGMVVAAAAFLLAACSSGPSAKSSSTSAAGGQTADVAAAQALLARYSGVPKFVPPGPSFNAAGARGKSVLMISLSDTDPFNVLIENALKQALAVDGVSASDYADQGQLSQWVQGMNTAISQKVNLVVLIGIDPGQIAPQIQAAQAAHIAVIDGQFVDTNHPYSAPFGSMPRVPSPYTLSGRLDGAQAIAATKGKANALIVESDDILSSGDVVKGIRSEFAKDCPACSVSSVNVPFNDWSTTGQTAVASALGSHPGVNYILPIFDSMVSIFVAPAVTASGAGSTVHVATYNASPAELKMLENGQLITMDSGSGYGWIGWNFADQALRALTGNPPASAVTETPPLRVFNSQNVSETGTPPVVGQGYGSAYQAAFKALWGLG